jgi:probable rRNA maturation factor
MSILVADHRIVRKPRISAEILATGMQSVVDSLGLPRGEIEINLVSKTLIRKLNREFRGMDKPTNALAFPHLIWLAPLKSEAPIIQYSRDDPPVMLGEIFLSVATIEADAEAAGVEFAGELHRMAIHALLHLFGFDHDTDEHEEEMLHWESKALNVSGLNPLNESPR